MQKPVIPNEMNRAGTNKIGEFLIENYFSGLADTLECLPLAKINDAIQALFRAYRNGGTVYLFGNGGSASLASHFACDLGKGTISNGTRRFRVLSLTDNLALLTAWANDTCYENIFAEQLRTFVRPGDIAFAISGSGNSANVLNGLRTAHEAGAATIALTGFQGGIAAGLSDIEIVVPSDDMQHIEDLHLAIAHSIFRAVREEICAQEPEAFAAEVS